MAQNISRCFWQPNLLYRIVSSTWQCSCCHLFSYWLRLVVGSSILRSAPLVWWVTLFLVISRSATYWTGLYTKKGEHHYMPEIAVTLIMHAISFIIFHKSLEWCLFIQSDGITGCCTILVNIHGAVSDKHKYHATINACWTYANTLIHFRDTSVPFILISLMVSHMQQSASIP